MTYYDTALIVFQIKDSRTFVLGFYFYLILEKRIRGNHAEAGKQFLKSSNLSTCLMPEASKLSIKPVKLVKSQALLASRNPKGSVYYYTVKTKF